MENPFFFCKTDKQLIPFPFFKLRNPHHLPAKRSLINSQTPSAPPSEGEPPPLASGKLGQRHLRRLCLAGKLQDAVSALGSASSISTRTYLLLLQSCIDSDSVELGRLLHSSLPLVEDPNPFVETKLVSMYAKCGDLGNARQVFDEMRERNLFTWSAMIGGYSREDRWEEVIELFYQMMREGLTPDAFLLPKILQACANMEDAATGRILHSLTIRCGFLEEAYVGNSMLALYAKCEEIAMVKSIFSVLNVKDSVTWNSVISAHCQVGENEKALKLFEQMRLEGIEPSRVTWNILISGYSQCGKPKLALEMMKKMERSGICPDVFTWTGMISGSLQNNKMSEALDLFREMWASGVEPNGMTVASTISACASLKHLKNGRELHGYAVKIAGSCDLLVVNSLIDLYVKCSRLEDAERIFNSVGSKDVFTWNSMIGGYMQFGYCGKAHELFLRMQSLGVRRNVVTWNVMISGYIQNREEDQAMDLFHNMEVEGVTRNTASWNALISGFLQNGDANKAFRVFRRMHLIPEKPNSITILSLLPACANLVSARKVKEIHGYVLRSSLHPILQISNSLIDSYSKSGNKASARALFHILWHKDLISWNSMMAGFILHGCSHAARKLFNLMRLEGVKPNQSTYKTMISAYGLDGLVSEGVELFTAMNEHRCSPCMEHYAAMIELYGRSGRLREAQDMITEMPIEPDSTVWNALLTAARYNSNAKLASLAAQHLIRLEPKSSRIQKLASRFDGGIFSLANPRKVIDSHGFHSCCWVEDKQKVHTFYTDDKTIDFSASPNLMDLHRITNELRKISPKFKETRHEAEELEENDEFHCERKAIAFSLSIS
ncbi:Pentatricopeptide repeat-containing protein [Apostasia shenzhenica]|uniref:Pentatricopeptide repeat-containing protein n=1 Tax=Apostasia shenzhenica TaxID=1088818 RepID=A0A2I0AFN1_9ASPA|nr:Pentatricopeptide repeat-containing protein [Apostasia shenzhenica]